MEICFYLWTFCFILPWLQLFVVVAVNCKHFISSRRKNIWMHKLCIYCTFFLGKTGLCDRIVHYMIIVLFLLSFLFTFKKCGDYWLQEFYSFAYSIVSDFENYLILFVRFFKNIFTQLENEFDQKDVLNDRVVRWVRQADIQEEHFIGFFVFQRWNRLFQTVEL